MEMIHQMIQFRKHSELDYCERIENSKLMIDMKEAKHIFF